MVVCSSKLPARDRETLFGMVEALGGQWRDSLVRDVTHLTLLSPTGLKYEKVASSPKLDIKTVLPHWFQLCITLQRILPNMPYLFPNPPILDSQFDESSVGMHDLDSVLLIPSASNTIGPSDLDPGQDATYGSIPQNDHSNQVVTLLPRPKSQFLSGYGVAIDSEIVSMWSQEWINALETHIAEAGATIIRPTETQSSSDNISSTVTAHLDWPRVDILICQYRSGKDYTKASRLGKVIGSYIWLFHIFSTGHLISPMKQLLHYPIPRIPIPEMSKCTIAISNYRSHAREYLKRLILAMGAKYTPYLTPKNTHLICASPFGEKHRRAIQWNVHVVHHIWLERCFQSWSLLSVSHRQFNTFAPGGLLQSVVGQCPIDAKSLGQWVQLAEEPDEKRQDAVDAGLSLNDIESLSDHKDSGEGLGVTSESSNSRIEETESEKEDASVDNDDDDKGESSQTPSQRYVSRKAATTASRALEQLMKDANAFEQESKLERNRKRSKSRRQTNNNNNNNQADNASTKPSKSTKPLNATAMNTETSAGVSRSQTLKRSRLSKPSEEEEEPKTKKRATLSTPTKSVSNQSKSNKSDTVGSPSASKRQRKGEKYHKTLYPTMTMLKKKIMRKKKVEINY